MPAVARYSHVTPRNDLERLPSTTTQTSERGTRMALSEIEKLERRYAENPQGLTFAPLAEVHRKNGDVARALELLRPGLTLHPDYIPASIVLGRCHLDLGDMPAAEAAFSHVLALDAENVIALKAVADITERLFRFEESGQWLRTLLTVDRSNDDARDQLERVEASRRQAEAASSAEQETAPVGAGSEERASDQAAAKVAPADTAAAAEAVTGEAAKADVADAELAENDLSSPVEVPSAFSIPPIPERPRDPAPAWMGDADADDQDEPMPLVLEELDVAAVPPGPPPEGIELEQPVTLEEPVQPLAGLVGRDQQSAEPGGADLVADFRVETAEDIVLESSGGSEFQMANAAEELLTGRVQPGPALTPHPWSEPEAPAEPAGSEHRTTEPEPAAPEPWVPASETAAGTAASEPSAWARPVAEPPRRSEPELMITESMAELLLQQGHAGEALKVYRHLESRNPGDARFLETIARLERAAADSPPAPAYSVLVTHGESVQAFLRGVLASRPPAAASAASVHAESSRPHGAADPEGAPTRPAHDSLSLSSVFGEESTPTPPAVPAAGSGSAGGVSYDDFFGAPGASPTTRPARASDPKSDDLDQFHAWLQNLKR
jgi:tetratricopeptide (TPR) repeat protein